MIAGEGKALLVCASENGNEGEQKIYRVSMLCKLEDCGLQTVAELKLLVEIKAGLDPELTALLHADHGELKDGVMLADLAWLPTTTELYAQTWMKVVVGPHLGIVPSEVTNDQFTTLCAALVSEPLDVLDLRGCTQVHDFSGLIQLSLSKLDISNCKLFAEGASALAASLKGNQGITKLDISSNQLGLNSEYGRDASGVIALADVFPDMGAMTSLNLASNRLYAGGTKIVAEAIKVKKCARTCNHVGTIFMSI
jgi:hypothetical protein